MDSGLPRFARAPERRPRVITSRVNQTDSVLRVVDRRVRAIAYDVEAARVPGIGHAAVAEIGEGDAGLRIGPAIGRADAAVAERARRGDRAEPADAGRRPARMRPEPAMHR